MSIFSTFSRVIGDGKPKVFSSPEDADLFFRDYLLSTPWLRDCEYDPELFFIFLFSLMMPISFFVWIFIPYILSDWRTLNRILIFIFFHYMLWSQWCYFRCVTVDFYFLFAYIIELNNHGPLCYVSYFVSDWTCSSLFLSTIFFLSFTSQSIDHSMVLFYFYDFICVLDCVVLQLLPLCYPNQFYNLLLIINLLINLVFEL